jgi:hypothetical protein
MDKWKGRLSKLRSKKKKKKKREKMSFDFKHTLLPLDLLKMFAIKVGGCSATLIVI